MKRRIGNSSHLIGTTGFEPAVERYLYFRAIRVDKGRVSIVLPDPGAPIMRMLPSIVTLTHQRYTLFIILFFIPTAQPCNLCRAHCVYRTNYEGPEEVRSMTEKGNEKRKDNFQCCNMPFAGMMRKKMGRQESGSSSCCAEMTTAMASACCPVVSREETETEKTDQEAPK